MSNDTSSAGQIKPVHTVLVVLSQSCQKRPEAGMFDLDVFAMVNSFADRSLMSPVPPVPG